MLTLKKGNIAVVPVSDPDQTPGGIWVPEIAKKRANQGVVKYIGADVKDIQVGDYVLFSGYTGTTVRLSGGEGLVIILNQEFVTAKIEISDNIIIPGLFFRSKVDAKHESRYEYFNATYEQSVPLLAAALEDFGNKLKVIAPKPKIEDYNAH